MKRNDDTYNRRYREDDRPEGMNIFTKIALFISLILAVYLIYTYSGDRVKKTEDVAKNVDYIVKPDLKNPGNIILKENVWFGNTYTIPKQNVLVFKTYCNDAVQLEFNVRYELKDDITPEQLLYYYNNKDYIEANLRENIIIYMSNTSAYKFYTENNIRKVMDIADKYSNRYNLNLLQVIHQYPKEIQDRIRKLKENESKSKILYFDD